MKDDLNTNPNMKPKRSGLIIILIIVILIMIGVGFWYWYAYHHENILRDQSATMLTSSDPTQSSSASTFSTSPTAESTVEAIADELTDENSSIYDNRAYGYTIRYPKNWNAVNIDDPQAQSVDLASTTDMLDGAVVSIALAEENTSYEDIQDWIDSRPVGDPEGANAKDATTYTTDRNSGIVFAKTETSEYNLLTYHWICASNVMSLSYATANSSDYDNFYPIFESILSSLIPCAG